MPCPTKEINNNNMAGSITAEWLSRELDNGKDLLVVDCRSQSDYSNLHVRGAINVAIPTLMLRRLKKGNLSVSTVINCHDEKEKFNKKCKTETLIVYDECTSDLNANSNSVISLLMRRLKEDGCQVCLLEGGFSSFQEKYLHHCVSEADSAMLGFGNLRIIDEQPKSSSDEEALSPNSSSPFPVQVLPYLYLGNEKNSGDLECLGKNGIKYILNVTPNVPNMFENEGTFKYMQIPISDHWSQNLAAFFPDAIAFIDEAREKKCGILVHCLAGISRSVTVTVAYLMQTQSLSLNDAYDLVKRCKPNISPNFNFMGQLLDFERTLQNSPCKNCDCCSSSAESGCDGSSSGTSSKESSPGSLKDIPICRCGTAKTYFSSPTSTAPHLPGLELPMTPS